MAAPQASAAPETLDDVPGWFYPPDQAVMAWLLGWQDRTRIAGDLLELGAYLGKSTILLGHHVRPGERLTVCDLFGAAAPDEENKTELAASYASLTRQTFERNYLAFHDELPVILQAPTSVIGEHVAPASCRFVHVDASHLFEHVDADIRTSRIVLTAPGIVACDDYRSAHTPGVAAAVWGAVLTGGLRPICLTANKFYGTWSDPCDVQDALLAWFAESGLKAVDVQRVAGHRVVRIDAWPDPPRPQYRARAVAEQKNAVDGPTPRPERGGAAIDPAPEVRRTGWHRKLARDLLPPVVTRAVRTARARAGRRPGRR